MNPDQFVPPEEKRRTSPIVWFAVLVVFAATMWWLVSSVGDFGRSSAGYDEMLRRNIETSKRAEAMFKKQVEDMEKEKQELQR